MKKWLTASEIAEVAPITLRSVQRRAEKENWPRRKQKSNGGIQYLYRLADLPEDIQSAYAQSIQTTLQELQKQLKSASKGVEQQRLANYTARSVITKPISNFDSRDEAQRNVAVLRAKIIEAYDKSGLSVPEFIRMYNEGVIASDVKERLGRWGLINTMQVFYSHWLLRYQQFGLEGLTPQYAKSRGGTGASLPEETKDRIEWLYLDTRKPSIPTIVEKLEKNLHIEVNESMVYRYVKALPPSLVTRYRLGEKAYHDKCETFISRDYTPLKSMETICGDYMTEDILCRIGERKLRAHLCAFEDMRSRTIVGWSLQLTANSVGVVRSLQMAFTQYGLPENVYVDNGKEFKNYWICGDEWKLRRTKIDPESLEQDAGILNECGVKVIFCQPYHGQSKPIERFWRTFHERFDKSENTYLGSNTVTRREEASQYERNINGLEKIDITLIPTFQEIEERIGNFINWYNAEWQHSGQGMDGKTPNQVFAENAVPRRDIPEHLKKYLFTMRYVKTIQRQGIQIDGIWYYNKEMSLLTGNKSGSKVEARRCLDNAGKVAIFSIPDRVYLYDAESLEWTGRVEEDIQHLNKLRREAKELGSRYNKKKAEYDAGGSKSTAELYAEKMAQLREPETDSREQCEDMREVVGGEPLGVLNRRRRLRLPTDPD